VKSQVEMTCVLAVSVTTTVSEPPSDELMTSMYPDAVVVSPLLTVVQVKLTAHDGGEPLGVYVHLGPPSTVAIGKVTVDVEPVQDALASADGVVVSA
jgi:hypothetical protein